MEEQLKKQVDDIVQKMMIIAQLEDDAKLRVLHDQSLEIQEGGRFQFLKRFWNGDTRQQCKEAMRTLYENLFLTADMLMNVVHLNIVLVMDKQVLTALENRVYLNYRHMLDQLTLWLGRTIPKLHLLNERAYLGKETLFQLIADKAQQKLIELEGYGAQLTEAYAKLAKQAPQAPLAFSRAHALPIPPSAQQEENDTDLASEAQSPSCARDTQLP